MCVRQAHDIQQGGCSNSVNGRTVHVLEQKLGSGKERSKVHVSNHTDSLVGASFGANLQDTNRKKMYQQDFMLGRKGEVVPRVLLIGDEAMRLWALNLGLGQLRCCRCCITC